MTTISQSPIPAGGFRVRGKDGKDQFVSPKRAAQAAAIDTNHDGVCDDAEIASYMRQQKLIKDPRYNRCNVPGLVNDYKTYLKGQKLEQADAYHSYDEMSDILHGLATDHPEVAAVTSLGKTSEGRDIWALKVSQGASSADTSTKPGVVFTGVHHAREWMSLEVPLHLAQTLVQNYGSDADTKRRVDGAEIWIVPMLNPDGYEYSRTEDPWWRKNRTPITATECPNAKRDDPPQPIAYGVDPNRNYWDGKPEHFFLYRPDDDKPCDTSDDFGASDSPDAEDYRGPHAASEPEVQAIMQLEYTHPNIRGVIDHHGYGEQFLRPWGYTTDPPADVAEYDEVASRMQQAQTNPFVYMQSAADYPTTGSSENSHEINGIKNFTIELGTSFQPPPEEFDDIKKNVTAADFAFLDWILEKNPTPQQPTPAPEPPPSATA